MYLLDTNVVSELRKVKAGRADPQVSRWAQGAQASALYLSVITVQVTASEQDGVVSDPS